MTAPALTMQGAPGGTQALPEITFKLKDAPPPSPLYVRADDSLFIRMSTADNLTLGVTFEARLLRPDGSITTFERTLFPGLNRVFISTLVTLGEGYLLGFSFDLGAQITRRGSTWCVVALQRLSSALGVPHQVLFQNYLVMGHRSGWPGSPIQTTTEGPGLLRPLQSGTPGAGAELSGGGATNARFQFINFLFSLTTSAAVANRQVTMLYVDTAVRSQVRSACGFLQLASTTITYSFFIGCQAGSQVGSVKNAPLPEFYTFTQGGNWQTLTENLQAGDQFTAAQFVQMELTEE